MRLIDADAWIQKYKKIIDDDGAPAEQKDYAIHMIEEIKTEPTAYNVDAVVKQMEETATVDGRISYCQQNKEAYCGDRNCFDCYGQHFVEIAKAGGIDGK